MLSRRDKLYIQPWEERRFKDHRSKVRSALPAIDAAAPAPRPHVAAKLKKWQRETDRQRQIERDNFSLLQRLAAIMRANRLDNHWATPLPNFHQRVGLYVDASSLRGRPSARGGGSREEPCASVRCYACDARKKTIDLRPIYNPRAAYVDCSLPSIF